MKPLKLEFDKYTLAFIIHCYNQFSRTIDHFYFPDIATHALIREMIEALKNRGADEYKIKAPMSLCLAIRHVLAFAHTEDPWVLAGITEIIQKIEKYFIDAREQFPTTKQLM